MTIVWRFDSDLAKVPALIRELAAGRYWTNAEDLVALSFGVETRVPKGPMKAPPTV